ncbi:MAG: hypothetical protein Q9227_003042 [Pyrenula ochraceoflavens]
MSWSLAAGLKDAGVNRGERVAVSLGNNIEHAVATYALFKIGAILVPLNPAFTSIQVISALTHLEASHLIIGAETNLPYKSPQSNIPLLQELVPDLFTSKLSSANVPSLKEIILVDNSSGLVQNKPLRATIPFKALLESTSYDRSPTSDSTLSNDDIVNIQFTSGTTSMPKAASLSHRSILNNGFSIGSRMLLTPSDIVCCPPPLFHCFGCILGYMATATHGSAIVFPSEAFDPKRTLRAVQDEKCTALYGVPTMFVAELELLSRGEVEYKGFQHLRTGIAAGSSIPAELMRKLHRTLNLTELTICYGMTETSPVSAMTTTDDPIEKRINTVGRLLPHVEAKVVDPLDRNKVLKRGERGELVVSGYLTMKRYWRQPEKTAEVLVEDPEVKGKLWMHTGDEAVIDEEGYVAITGRIKDLIIRGGENIHPLEIENCLFAHPKVKEISVVGLPDERYGEVVGAFVVPQKGSTDNASEENLTEAEVKSWVKSRLSNHLVPKHVFFVDNYPKTASGKIQKFKLRDLGQSLLKDE